MTPSVATTNLSDATVLTNVKSWLRRVAMKLVDDVDVVVRDLAARVHSSILSSASSLDPGLGFEGRVVGFEGPVLDLASKKLVVCNVRIIVLFAILLDLS